MTVTSIARCRKHGTVARHHAARGHNLVKHDPAIPTNVLRNTSKSMHLVATKH